MGLSESTLLAKLNPNANSKLKRDLVIAICFFVRADIDETNDALKLTGLANLDVNNPREMILMELIEKDAFHKVIKNIIMVYLDFIISTHGCRCIE